MKRLTNPRLWNLDLVLFSIALVMIGVTGLIIPIQSDTWWLLKTGHDILKLGHPITQELHSHTFLNHFWPNHEWFSELAFYATYRVGGFVALSLLAAAITWGTWALVIRQMRGPLRVQGLLIMLGLVAMVSGWSIRPQLFTMLFLAVALTLLEHPRPLLIYPALLLLWANFHAGVSIGGIVLIAACLAALWRFRAHFWLWAGTTVLAALATLLTPLGWRLWTFVLESFNTDIYAGISEWAAPQFNTVTGALIFGLVAALLFSVYRLRHSLKTHREWTMVITALLLAYMTLGAARHSGLLVVAALPILSWNFRDWQPLAQAPPAGGRLYQLVLASLLLAGLALVIVKPRETQPFDQPTLAALQGCPGNLYNTYIDGGPLLWFAPEVSVIIDNRFDPYSLELFNQVNAAEQGQGYAELFAQYAVRCAILPVDAPLAARLQADGWLQASATQQHTVWYR